GHGGGVAETGAMVDVVGAEPRAHQLLEEVGLLVAALGGAEARQCVRAVLVADTAQTGSRDVQGFLPVSLAEVAGNVLGAQQLDRLGGAFTADQGPRQPFRVVNVVETITALDA